MAAEKHLFRYDVARGQLTPVCGDFDTTSGTFVADDLTRAIRIAGDQLEICDLATGTRSTLPGYAGEVYPGTLQLSGSLAYAHGRSGAVLWNLREGRRYVLDPGSREPVSSAELIAGDRGVAILGHAFVAVFDAHGRLVHTLTPASQTLMGVTASNDKRFAVVSDYNEHARLYDFATKRSRVLEHHLAGIGAGFIGEPPVIVTLGQGNRIYRWSDDLPTDPAGIETWVRQAALGIDLDANGGSMIAPALTAQ